MNPSSSHNAILSLAQPWLGNANSIWLGSKIALNRNVEKFKFPGKLDDDRRKQIVSLISKSILDTNLLKGPSVILSEEASAFEKEFLMEHFLTTQSLYQATSGEAFVIDSTGEFLGVMNMRDHMRLTFVDCRGELENTWTRAVQLETAIGKTVSYAFSSKYGFLTADPGSCGTGLTAAVYLQVPALIHLDKIDGILEKLADDSIGITGIQGNPTEIIGDILVVQNNYSLGVTEENILSTLRSFTTKLMLEENGERNRIKHEENAEIKDRVSRAYGILVHSYQIEAVESLNAISLLKLGTEMGWMIGITPAEMNQLFFNCRRAHLLRYYEEKITAQEIPHKRAEFIHKALQNTHLTI